MDICSEWRSSMFDGLKEIIGFLKVEIKILLDMSDNELGLKTEVAIEMTRWIKQAPVMKA